MAQVFARTLAPALVALIWLTALFVLWRQDGGLWAGALAGLIGGGALVLQAAVAGAPAVSRVFGLEPLVAATLGLLATLSILTAARVLPVFGFALIDDALGWASMNLEDVLAGTAKAGLAVTLAAALGHVAGIAVASDEGAS